MYPFNVPMEGTMKERLTDRDINNTENKKKKVM